MTAGLIALIVLIVFLFIVAASGVSRATVSRVLTGTDYPVADETRQKVLRAAKELDPELPVIVMTAYGSIQDAVAAMKEGALDFLAKPVDPDHLLLMVDRALAQRCAEVEREGKIDQKDAEADAHDK